MLDLENVKKILQTEVDNLEKAKARLKKCRSFNNYNSFEEIYERRCHRYVSRFNGMCDLLYELGFSAGCNDDNVVIVKKRE